MVPVAGMLVSGTLVSGGGVVSGGGLKMVVSGNVPLEVPLLTGTDVGSGRRLSVVGRSVGGRVMSGAEVGAGSVTLADTVGSLVGMGMSVVGIEVGGAVVGGGRSVTVPFVTTGGSVGVGSVGKRSVAVGSCVGSSVGTVALGVGRGSDRVMSGVLIVIGMSRDRLRRGSSVGVGDGDETSVPTEVAVSTIGALVSTAVVVGSVAF